MLKQFFYYFLTKSLIKYNDNPMITYVPVIMYLEENYSIKKVLETGSGLYSTSLFLDKRYFKNLQKLVSYENELKWFKKVKKKF